MNEIVDKSTHFKQVCQLLVSLIVAIIHPRLRRPRQMQMMLTILMNKSDSFDQQKPFKKLIIIKSSGIPSGSTVVPSVR